MDSAGNVYAAGGNISLVSYDSEGNQRFVSNLGLTNNSTAYGVAVNSAGDTYITGKTLGSGAGNQDIFLMKAGGQCQ